MARRLCLGLLLAACTTQPQPEPQPQPQPEPQPQPQPQPEPQPEPEPACTPAPTEVPYDGIDNDCDPQTLDRAGPVLRLDNPPRPSGDLSCFEPTARQGRAPGCRPVAITLIDEPAVLGMNAREVRTYHQLDGTVAYVWGYSRERYLLTRTTQTLTEQGCATSDYPYEVLRSATGTVVFREAREVLRCGGAPLCQDGAIVWDTQEELDPAPTHNTDLELRTIRRGCPDGAVVSDSSRKLTFKMPAEFLSYASDVLFLRDRDPMSFTFRLRVLEQNLPPTTDGSAATHADLSVHLRWSKDVYCVQHQDDCFDADGCPPYTCSQELLVDHLPAAEVECTVDINHFIAGDYTPQLIITDSRSDTTYFTGENYLELMYPSREGNAAMNTAADGYLGTPSGNGLSGYISVRDTSPWSLPPRICRDSEQRFVVDGIPTLLLGADRVWPAGEYSSIPELTGSCFNAVFSPIVTGETWRFLRDAREHQIFLLPYMDTYWNRLFYAPNDWGVLGAGLQMLSRLRHHPQVFGYYTADEPSIYYDDVHDYLRFRYQIMREHDGSRPALLTLTTQGVFPEYRFDQNHSDAVLDYFKEVDRLPAELTAKQYRDWDAPFANYGAAADVADVIAPDWYFLDHGNMATSKRTAELIVPRARAQAPSSSIVPWLGVYGGLDPIDLSSLRAKQLGVLLAGAVGTFYFSLLPEHFAAAHNGGRTAEEEEALRQALFALTCDVQTLSPLFLSPTTADDSVLRHAHVVHGDTLRQSVLLTLPRARYDAPLSFVLDEPALLLLGFSERSEAYGNGQQPIMLRYLQQLQLGEWLRFDATTRTPGDFYDGVDTHKYHLAAVLVDDAFVADRRGVPGLLTVDVAGAPVSSLGGAPCPGAFCVTLGGLFNDQLLAFTDSAFDAERSLVALRQPDVDEPVTVRDIRIGAESVAAEVAPIANARVHADEEEVIGFGDGDSVLCTQKEYAHCRYVLCQNQLEQPLTVRDGDRAATVEDESALAGWPAVVRVFLDDLSVSVAAVYDTHLQRLALLPVVDGVFQDTIPAWDARIYEACPY